MRASLISHNTSYYTYLTTNGVIKYNMRITKYILEKLETFREF